MSAITVIVEDPKNEGFGPTKHTTYKITCTGGSDKASARHRFSAFVTLRTDMLDLLPGVVVPPLPEKQVMNRFSAEFIEKRREMLSNAPLPNEEQTPGEVIELVLRALRDVDWPRAGHGVEILQSYSGPGSILGENRPEVTAQMLQDYFEASKYGILLDWVAIQYLRKLELCECSCRHTAYGLECVRSSPLTFALSRCVFHSSPLHNAAMDKKRALQQLRLTSRNGDSVPVTFQLSKHDTSAGSVWLIDQLLVKTKPV